MGRKDEKRVECKVSWKDKTEARTDTYIPWKSNSNRVMGNSACILPSWLTVIKGKGNSMLVSLIFMSNVR